VGEPRGAGACVEVLAHDPAAESPCLGAGDRDIGDEDVEDGVVGQLAGGTEDATIGVATATFSPVRDSPMSVFGRRSSGRSAAAGSFISWPSTVSSPVIRGA
jgi:hypothetical protein